MSLIEASKQTKVHIHVCVASTMQYLTQHHALVGSVLIGLSVVHSYRETPGPIPNPEAKPARADGTAPGREWESRLPPTQQLHTQAPATQHHRCAAGAFHMRGPNPPGWTPHCGQPQHHPSLVHTHQFRARASLRIADNRCATARQGAICQRGAT